LDRSRQRVAILYNESPLSHLKLPLPVGIWTPSNIGPTWFSRFCRAQYCDRPTDHATRSVTIGRIYVRSTAMRPINVVMHRDGHETSVAETETRRSDFETRPRRDVCRSRDVTETLKCTFIVINGVLLKQVNVVGLTTVAILSPRVRLFHGRYTARTRPCTRPSARSCTRSCTRLCT